MIIGIYAEYKRSDRWCDNSLPRSDREAEDVTYRGFVHADDTYLGRSVSSAWALASRYNC